MSLLLALGAVVVCFVAPLASSAVGHEQARAVSAQTGGGGRVVMVIIDRLGVVDYQDSLGSLPNIRGLVTGGSSALMNARSKYNLYGIGNYLVIGAGGRALGGTQGGLAFNTDETLIAESGSAMTAGNVYRTRTGRIPRPGSVVNLNIEFMSRETAESPVTTGTPGMLGEAIRKAGRKVAVLGNADAVFPSASGGVKYGGEMPVAEAPEGEEENPNPLETRIHREVSLIAMDEEGQVELGDVSSRLNRPSEIGAGLGTDFDALVNEALALIPRSDLTVIDMGQTTRVDEQAVYYRDSTLVETRRRALEQCDRALGGIMRGVDLNRDLLIVCTPSPTRRMIRNLNVLTPLIIAGKGVEKGGRLYSATTRRTGLITNFDIGPTILDFLGIDIPTGMEGQRMLSYDPGHASLEDLVEMGDRYVNGETNRQAMVRFLTISTAAFFGLLLLLSLLRKNILLDHPYFWSYFLVALLAAPFAYFVLPLFGQHGPFASLSIVLGLQFFIALLPMAALAWRRKRGVHGAAAGPGPLGVPEDLTRVIAITIAAICAATLVSILADTFFGSYLNMRSPLGSSVISGARYYGVGNFLMGVTLGLAIVLACLLPSVFPETLASRKRAIGVAAAILVVTVVLLGYPRLGANVGGLVTGVLAAAFTLLKMRGKRVSWKTVAVICGIVVVCIGLLFLLDILLPGTTSHAGRALENVRQKGVGEVFRILSRQELANWKLALASNWRFVFLIGIACAIVWKYTLRMYDRVKGEFVYMSSAWWGLITTLVVALVFNDSGIEPAGAVTIVFIATTLLLFLAVIRSGAGAKDPPTALEAP